MRTDVQAAALVRRLMAEYRGCHAGKNPDANYCYVCGAASAASSEHFEAAHWYDAAAAVVPREDVASILQYDQLAAKQRTTALDLPRKLLDALVQWVDMTGVIHNPALHGCNLAPLDAARAFFKEPTILSSPAKAAKVPAYVEQRRADRLDGYDKDDIGASPDY